LSDGQCTDFADDAGKQAVGLFCIVADCFFISITKLLKICNMYNFFFIYLSTIRLLFNSANGLFTYHLISDKFEEVRGIMNPEGWKNYRGLLQ
jgi:hypothetical protein